MPIQRRGWRANRPRSTRSPADRILQVSDQTGPVGAVHLQRQRASGLALYSPNRRRGCRPRGCSGPGKTSGGCGRGGRRASVPRVGAIQTPRSDRRSWPRSPFVERSLGRHLADCKISVENFEIHHALVRRKVPIGGGYDPAKVFAPVFRKAGRREAWGPVRRGQSGARCRPGRPRRGTSA